MSGWLTTAQVAKQPTIPLLLLLLLLVVVLLLQCRSAASAVSARCAAVLLCCVCQQCMTGPLHGMWAPLLRLSELQHLLPVHEAGDDLERLGHTAYSVASHQLAHTAVHLKHTAV